MSEEPRAGSEESAPIDLQDTPFFHFDLACAVRSAESGLERRTASSRSSLYKSEELRDDKAVME